MLKGTEEQIVKKDRELEAIYNETHFVEFDKYGSGKIEVSFGQVLFIASSHHIQEKNKRNV